MTQPRLTASMRAVIAAPLFVTEFGRTSGPNKRDFVRYELTGAGESLRTELKGK